MLSQKRSSRFIGVNLLVAIAIILTCPVSLANSDAKTIKWTDLIPEQDLKALENPPAYLDEIEDGSEDDQLSGQFQSEGLFDKDDPYQQALVSTRIKPEYNNQLVRLPGFIVPLEFDDEQVVTRFFFVPFFGACIHVPPPPPNQIIYAKFDKGIQLDVLYDPFWIEGKLITELIENDVAKSAYTMNVNVIEPYVEEPQ
ncbi:DUF3299 domain-containing protein [Bermanella sp. R86510]|uniref:DUF3299 domain-containing protein n=1 Tax=unclassified Bermanella TaxID=2627862 RepID=UPI0037C89311